MWLFDLFFLNSATLICRSTYIFKYFRESLGIRDNDSRLYISVKCGCSNYFYLSSANLICRGTDISKYFIESLGFRDNESRLNIKSDQNHFTSVYVHCINEPHLSRQISPDWSETVLFSDM